MAKASVAELARQSGFVFQGSVRRIGASAERVEPASAPGTAVVVVEKIFKGPEALSHFAGREVTLVFEEREAPESGRHTIFFAVGLHYGEGLTLREVGRVDAAGSDVERAVHDAMAEAGDEVLLARIRGAQSVVTGVVVRVAPCEYRERVGSEHDPEWWKFVIAVESVEKGDVKMEKVKGGAASHLAAFFPHSEDVAWYRAPKLREGDAGIFILHDSSHDKLLRSHPAPGPAVVHALDVQPMRSVQHVRALVERASR